MSCTLKQTRRFARAYKKLHDKIAADVDSAAETVAADPALGDRKKGISLTSMSTSFTARTNCTCWVTHWTMRFAWST